jgi:hypothetical protein
LARFTPDEFLSGRTPLQALRDGVLEAVRTAAAAFGAHGGR